MRGLLGPALVMLVMSACGQPAPGIDPGTDVEADYDGAWQLLRGEGPAGPIKVPPETRITLVLDGATAGGIAACNQYGGDVVIEASSFKGSGYSMTDMGCEPEIMEAESRYIEALMGVDSIRREADTLFLTGPSTELEFEFNPPPPTASLTDVKWHLEALMFGEGDDATVTNAHPATLQLHDDGTLTGTTGCRRLDGEWHIAGDEITFSYFVAEGDCGREKRDQDGYVVSIGDGVTFDIEGRVLTIFPRLGEVDLQYRAED